MYNLVFEINMSLDRSYETWIVANTTELIDDLRARFVYAYKALIYYLSLPKPIMIFPIDYTPDVGKVFQGHYLINADTKFYEDLSGVIFINNVFIKQCLGGDKSVVEHFKNMKLLRHPDFFQTAQQEQGALYLGIRMETTEEDPANEIPQSTPVETAEGIVPATVSDSS